MKDSSKAPRARMKLGAAGPSFDNLSKAGAAALLRALIQDSVLILGGLLALSRGRALRAVIGDAVAGRAGALDKLSCAAACELGPELESLLFRPLWDSDAFSVIKDSQDALCNMVKLVFCRERAFFAALGPALEPEPGFFAALETLDEAAAQKLAML